MSSNFLIRKAKPSDFDSINELMSDLGYLISSSQVEDRRKVFSLLLENSSQEIFVLTEKHDEKILGTLNYSILPKISICGLKMELTDVVVSKEKRGKGIGEHLIRFAIDQAKERGVKTIVLSTNRARESYQRDFYKKLGFTEKNSAFFEFKP